MGVRIKLAEAAKLGLEAPGTPRKRPKAKKAVVDDSFYREMVRAACVVHGIPEPFFEYTFCEGRKWRFDLCWRAELLAVEVQGGIHVGGRHVRGAALEAEHEKLNAAAILGYRVLFVQPRQVQSGYLWELVKLALGL